MENIRAILTIEILGRPADHVKETMSQIVEKIGSTKGVKVISHTDNEPIPAQNSKTLFTTFSEIEAEFEDLNSYFQIIFAYLPSHIDVIEPAELVLRNEDVNELTNIILQRLHNYETITKTALAERDKLFNKLKETAPDLFKKSDSKDSSQSS